MSAMGLQKPSIPIALEAELATDSSDREKLL